jgi:membrane-associated phospholipid phosphatase
MIGTLRRQLCSLVARLAPMDRNGLRAVQRVRSTPLNRAAAAFCHLGRGGLVWFALTPLVGSGRRPISPFEGTAISVLAIGSALGGSTAIARIASRQRPCDQGVRSLIPCPEGGSFPSDQAAASFAAAEILGWFAPAARQWMLGTAAILAVARVVAGVHYPSDVVAGGIIGGAIGRGSSAVAERRSRQDRAKLAPA